MSACATDTIAASDRLRLPRRIILFCAFMITGGNLLIPREPLLLLILLLGVTYFGALSLRVSTRKMVAYTWLVLVMIVGFLRLQPIDVVVNITRLLNFVIGLLLLRMYWDEGRSRLVSDLRALIYPMVYQAIVTVIIAVVVPAAFLLVEVGTLRFYSFLGVLNYHVIVEGASRLVRPNGFFYEPGVFQIYLNILLFILFSQHARWRQILLTLGAVLLTQSTTGILIAAAQLLYFSTIEIFLRSNSVRKRTALLMIAMLSPLVYVVAEQNIETKLMGALAGSYFARTYDLQTGLRIITEHPILGIGFNHSVYLATSIQLNPDTEMLSEANSDGRASTIGLLIVLYSVGLPLGLIYLLAFFFQKLLPHRVMFAVILILSLSTEPLSFAPLFALFAFSGFSRAPRQRSSSAERTSLALEHPVTNLTV